MLDFKIATAVFVSLAIIAFSMQGADISPQDNITLEEPENETIHEDNQNILDRSLNIISELMQRIRSLPEPENPVQVQIQTEELEEYSQEITDATITSPELKEVSINQQNIETTEPLTLYNFTGSIEINQNNTRISGTTTRAQNQQVSLENLEINQNIETQTLTINNQKRTQFNFENATGTIKQEDTEIDITNDKLNINSFTGNQTINLQQNAMNLEGKVHTLESSKITIN